MFAATILVGLFTYSENDLAMDFVSIIITNNLFMSTRPYSIIG